MARPRVMTTPRRARLPVTTAMTAGVASDSAQGQVTMSTDTATHSAREASSQSQRPAAASALS
jgi:hypothetical protein